MKDTARAKMCQLCTGQQAKDNGKLEKSFRGGILNVVMFFLLGASLASEFYVPTFRNTAQPSQAL